MIFKETALPGACVVELEERRDERGSFARSWCAREFEAHGLNPRIAQCNISFNFRKGTLRGMHYQIKPFEEAKLVRCTRGALYDVIVDLRPDSPAYKKSLGVLLTPDNGLMIYVPEGFAHGFLTMADGTEVHYQISEFFAPDHARGFRWNDPAFGVSWPAPVEIIAERDRSYPDYRA